MLVTLEASQLDIIMTT